MMSIVRLNDWCFNHKKSRTASSAGVHLELSVLYHYCIRQNSLRLRDLGLVSSVGHCRVNEEYV